MANIVSGIARNLIEKIAKTKFSYLDEIFNPRISKSERRWVLLLPGKGCVWAREHGGCYMCGFNAKINQIQKGRPSSAGRLIRIFQLGKLVIDNALPKSLIIYNGGSFLNDDEIPFRVQSQICQDVAKHPTLRKLVIESRPEFVTQEKIRSLISLLRGKTLQVGIGLECQSDEIRTRCVHKGFLREDYERAAAVLRQERAELLTYVFLKPIYLSEKEAAEEAVATIEYAFRIGSDEVALESAFIQNGTRMEMLYNRGEYKPPWLWSIIEVVKRTHHLGPVRIGGFEDEPPPIDIPRNCPQCSSQIMTLFAEYKKTHNIKLFDGLDCQCKQSWQKDFSK